MVQNFVSSFVVHNFVSRTKRKKMLIMGTQENQVLREETLLLAQVKPQKLEWDEIKQTWEDIWNEREVNWIDTDPEEPIKVSKHYRIVDGHHRYAFRVKNCYKEVPVKVVDSDIP